MRTIIITLAIFVAGCAAQAMPPVSKPVATADYKTLTATLDTNAPVPFNAVNFYYARSTDTNFTFLTQVPTTNGAAQVQADVALTQPWNSTYLLYAECTNTTLTYQSYASDYLVFSNVLGPQPELAIPRPLALHLK